MAGASRVAARPRYGAIELHEEQRNLDMGQLSFTRSNTRPQYVAIELHEEQQISKLCFFFLRKNLVGQDCDVDYSVFIIFALLHINMIKN